MALAARGVLSVYRRYHAKIYDPSDGLYVNTIRYGSRVSSCKSLMTDFDSDMVMILSPDGKHSFRKVSVVGSVRKINRYKSTVLNGLKGILNQRD